LIDLSQKIDPGRLTGLDYYPLIKPGDRFPINDPHQFPRLEPRPDSPIMFLQAMLEGMARIEAQGYALLQQLGAPPLIRVKTTGGGAKNLAWMTLRQQQLGVPVSAAEHVEAAYGTAMLALASLPL
jgi:sugar (pentulose or hexulose) kinase